MQYGGPNGGETDFEFISRLCEHEGIYYFFRHEAGQHTLVFADDIASSHGPLPGGEEVRYHPDEKAGMTGGLEPGERITEWVQSEGMRPGHHQPFDLRSVVLQESKLHMSTEPIPPAPSLSAWLRAARTPYLNLLRNLTPQVLLASLAWAIASKLDFSRFDLSNIGPTFAFFAFLALFGFAVYANSTLFLSELFPGLMPWIAQRESSLKESGVARSRMPISLLASTFKERKLELALAIISLAMLDLVLAGVLASSISTAFTFIHAVKG